MFQYKLQKYNCGDSFTMSFYRKLCSLNSDVDFSVMTSTKIEFTNQFSMLFSNILNS